MNSTNNAAAELGAKPFGIVVGIDFTAPGDLALERACDWAVAHSPTRVHVVHVTEDFALGPLTSGSSETHAVAQADAMKVVSARLNDRVQQIVRRWCSVHARQPSFERLTTDVRLGSASESIAQFASDVEAELIVLGTHGRRRPLRFLLGSVAEGTMRLASCDVLVVRPPDATIPTIEPPCSDCVQTRRVTNGKEMWCVRHREHHDRAHTYHFSPERDGHQSGMLIHVK